MYLEPTEDKQNVKPSIAERTAKKVALFEKYKKEEEIARQK